MLGRFFKVLFVSLLVLILAAGGFLFAALQDQPAVTQAAPPAPEDVRNARRFLRELRAATEAEPREPELFSVTETELNSLLRLGARFVRGFRGRIDVRGDHVDGAASIPVRYAGQEKWLNLRARAPAFEGRFGLDRVALGPFALPPGPTLEAGRILLNAVFGNRLGDTALSAATAMRIDGDAVSFALAIDDIGKNGVMRGIFGTLRGADMPDALDVDRYYRLLRQAMDRGALPATGSYLPYLQFMLDAAHEGSRTEGVSNAYTSAIFALARACGARDFTMVVGGLAGGETVDTDTWRTDCKDLTLNGRVDSRRHFTTAAALQAASNRGFAISVGEFKELYDSLNTDDGGFDFTDLAANNSGIRMSNTLMAAPADRWPGMLARITGENDVIIAFDTIPHLMKRDVFQRTYGDVDSPEYQAMLARIEKLIDALALHR